ncbi:MAG: bifunctional anthranilate synthase component II/anthranilate phosphoribosyltransferase [Spirochaetota bacterium]
MYLIIDNYDSFTYNIVATLAKLTDESVEVIRNDQLEVKEIYRMQPKGIILSPGPGRPEDAGICLEVVRTFSGVIPILGICLGHQVIGQAFGAQIVQARRMMHGKRDLLQHDGRGVLRSLPTSAAVVRYHSLCIDASSCPEELEITARASDGEVMGIRHRLFEVEGVQFHPESIAAEEGSKLLKNFLRYRREPFEMRHYLQKVMGGTHLSRAEAAEVMDELTEGDLHSAQIAAFLTALNIKGFTSEEIAGCAGVLRDKRVPLESSREVLDTCGTGGDGLGTFNISSISALVCAAGGIPVAKHGNRAVSSMSGSADFYRALGIHIDLTPQEAAGLLEKTGFTFLYAPYYHGAMRHAAGVRRGLGMKTIMNVLGPLSNPAESAYQLLGVYEKELLVTVARAAKALGCKRIMTVHGRDGEDEISAVGETDVYFIDEEGNEKQSVITPEEVGLPRCLPEELRGGTAEENVHAAQQLLRGTLSELLKENSPLRGLSVSVLLNSGAAFYVAGRSQSLAEGVELARQIVGSSKLLHIVEQIVRFSHMFVADTPA